MRFIDRDWLPLISSRGALLTGLVYRGQEKRISTGYIIGHEFTGVVLSVGSEVKLFKQGDPVVSPFTRLSYTQERLTVALVESVSIALED
jgi:Alcohol dehydrogenase GroES-like domain